MDTWPFSEAEKVKGGKEEEWRPTSVRPSLCTSRLSNSHFSTWPLAKVCRMHVWHWNRSECWRGNLNILTAGPSGDVSLFTSTPHRITASLPNKTKHRDLPEKT